MRIDHRWLGRGVLGLGLGVTALSGCQTYFGGMTLPSPHYLQHPPQYFPPDPAFPLQREHDSMLDPDGAFRRGAVGPAVPAIAPPPPAGGIAPAPGLPPAANPGGPAPSVPGR